jgi:predicted nucleic acid-binding protein
VTLVVADSSPLHYLILIGQAELLPRLFKAVVIPDEVYRELTHVQAPLSVLGFMRKCPEWLAIQTPRDIEEIPSIDAGEQAAICLARELKADLLLIDDVDGRRAAQARGIAVTGTLGILDRAAQRDLIDLRHVLQQLKATSMHLSDELLNALLDRHDDSG